MQTWAATDPAVTEWVHKQTAAGAEGAALARAVLAWAHRHGAISLEVSGQFDGMGHDGGTMLTAQINALADAFALD
ncbi:WHG domain-containing protein [Streptomyces sp. NBC_00631]|uniref:WHG domain-containing protein n=1 Tax=Streptomyces sp. NBC_00631 TaxID=2975793 RepID=UPI0030DE3D01